ncbi:phage integrase [Roseibium sp. TrichSKD4]|uniref:tyrosine-type recombinase/integrase n=1 Tax=Roseibium sp. TrichSKD4 TaxID=744980 RepID=UPI0001E56D91|nr:site-specific integrase [Roseibium sp. TrichSKD4]EFO31523.1 phage integrase [Roseibium sp. TrichSKD4]
MPLKLYKRGEVWHYAGTVAGHRLRGSCRTTQKTTAQQIAAKVEARYWQSHLNGPEAVLTFAQAALLHREAEKSDRFLVPVEDYWKNTLVNQITPGAIRKSALDLYPNAGAATRNRQVIVPTQAIINHAAELELCSRVSVKRFPVERKEKEPATAVWIERFMVSANPHLGALALFMFCTGARISEALNVHWEDVSLTDRKALIRQTKIMDERRAHLPAHLVAAMANIEGDRTGKVFKYSSRDTAKIQWNKVIKRAGIKHLSFHACRHGFATTMLQAGVDPVTVAKRGGWKDTQQLFRTYGHASEDNGVIDRVFDTPVAHAKTAKKII